MKFQTMLAPMLVGGALQTIAEPVPMKPIPSEMFAGGATRFVLSNPVAHITLVPTVGRIGELALHGKPDLLRLDTGTLEYALKNGPIVEWKNVGGDWLWPVSQVHWTKMQEKNWPPPPALADEPWTASAWKNGDGSSGARFERDFAAPVSARITRRFELDAEASRLVIHQRIERTAASDIPLTLWNITQVPGVQKALFPVETNSAFAGGFVVMAFDPPRPEILTPCGDTLSIDLQNITEHKLGSDSPRGWIAARIGDQVLVERAIPVGDSSGPYPDNGCRIELYSNKGLGYTEIETLSEERNLAPGEAIENQLELIWFTVATDIADCDLIAAIKTRLAESAP